MIARAASLALMLGVAAPALAQDAALAFVAGPDVIEVPPGAVEAIAGEDPPGQHIVTLSLDADLAARFADLTARNIGEVVEVRICGAVAIAPRVMERIEGGTIRISGAFTAQEVADLARRISDSDCEDFSSPFST
ncbi:SecDF P1 head subdomain-containing protein [Frigidibacter sp. ROC022]|uniref:SecDF P1 head subdomain-containing protein n=1 Tax=Frigidibacter sp. ROC022 TaxID=2971796 RepID=UPI00215A4ECE|nr:hypothetical protein [Frigidibacter sp. ROC022]MCR8724936.1 hypothetical protein [Frigidibacter sp. ROC022]